MLYIMPLVDSHKIFLPPLHIKLAMDSGSTRDGFQNLRNEFDLEKSEARLKYLSVPKSVNCMMCDDEFASKRKPDELTYWEAFVLVVILVKNILDNQRA